MSDKKIFYWCLECKTLHPALEAELEYGTDSGDVARVETYQIENQKAKLIDSQDQGLTWDWVAYTIYCPETGKMIDSEEREADFTIDTLIEEIVTPSYLIVVENGKITAPEWLKEEYGVTEEKIKQELAKLL